MGHRKLGLWLGLAPSALLLQGVFALPASAQDCVTDDECPTGTRCDFAASVDGGAASTTDPGAAPTREPATAPDCPPDSDCTASDTPAAQLSGLCAPLPEGTCESASDCDPRLECVKDQVASACPPSTSSEPCVSDTGESRYGSCELPVMACQTDSDCLAGLTCVDGGDVPVSGGGSSGSSDGSAPSAGSGSTTKAAEKFCDYQATPCTTDAECPNNFECASLGTTTVCSGGAVACAEGATCPQPTETCSEEALATECLPKKLPCVVDSQCPTGFVCFEFSAEGLTPPAAWNVTAPFQSCLPEGLALVELAYGARGVSLDGNLAGESQDPTATPDDHEADTGAAKSDLPTVNHGDGSFCAVGVTRGGQAWLTALLGLLGLTFVRRRARR